MEIREHHIGRLEAVRRIDKDGAGTGGRDHFAAVLNKPELAPARIATLRDAGAGVEVFSPSFTAEALGLRLASWLYREPDAEHGREWPSGIASGIDRLREAGIEVEVGVLADEVRHQLAPYLTHRTTGRPWVVLKLGMSVDGRTAAPDGTAEAAEQVAEAMRGVDWAKVRAATSERSADAAAAMRTMAKEVDWAKVQPVAAKVSSALMAAVASGQLGVGGRLGSTVARAIINDRNLAHRVSTELVRQEQPLPPDFRNVIDVTATES